MPGATENLSDQSSDKRIETQVGQIYINNKRLSKSSIVLFSEKIQETEAEIYVIAEMPNAKNFGSAEQEKISRILVSSLKRNFKKPNPNAFENAIANINTALAELTSEGVTGWIENFNSCLAVRQGQSFYIATTGKVCSYLLRDRELSNIADSPPKPNPLKTFENFAVGKIKAGDLVMLSTVQLLNYVSIERLKQMLGKMPLDAACEQIVQLAKETADSSISFGTLFLELDLAGAFAGKGLSSLEKVKGMISMPKLSLPSIAILKNAEESQEPAAASAQGTLSGSLFRLPHFNFQNFRIQNIKALIPVLLPKIKSAFDISKIKSWSKAKKFFFASASLFIMLLIVNIAVASRNLAANRRTASIKTQLAVLKDKLNNDVSNAYLYENAAKAGALLTDVENQLNALEQTPETASQRAELQAQIDQMEETLNKIQRITPSVFASDISADHLILLSDTLYTVGSANSTFTGYDLASKIRSENFSVGVPNLSDLAFYDNAILAKTSEGSIYKIDTKTKNADIQKLELPAESTGLALFSNPIKAYTIDKNENRIVSGAISGTTTSDYLKQTADVSSSIDLTIDPAGSVFILYPDKIAKYVSGQARQFNSPDLDFSNGSRIYATSNLIYVMNTASDSIAILDKNGQIITQFKSDQFKGAKDIAVDEKNKELYILTASTLFSVKLP